MNALLRYLALAAAPLTLCAAEPAHRVSSPDGRVAVEVTLAADGAPRYVVAQMGRAVLQPSKLGLVRDDADFTHGLTLLGESEIELVRDRYEILTAKRRLNTYTANRRVFHLATAAGAKLDVVFQVSNDGVAFRYVFPEKSATVHGLKEEVTSFHVLPGARAWLQPMSVAKTGWANTNPSYEEYYEKDIPAGTPSPLAGWVYPALFRSGETWLLVSEGELDRTYCGTRLRKESPDGEYSVGFPDEREVFPGGGANPRSTLPWRTPWRLIVVGSLKTVAESMLGVDLADPAPTKAPKYLPGKAAWSWPLLGDKHTTFDVQKQFVDYAADMGWAYCLVDAQWDQQIGYERMKELVDYAQTKHVRMLVWYNSAGPWNQAPQTPRDRLLTPDSRRKEFERLKAIGIAGLKVDFFGGDGQSMIAYYQDLLDDAARYGFVMNFHGATLPRGWQRTYPQLMTMEAIKGEEFITFEQKNADEEPAHATMLPFTRNVFDPMDFTPVVLDHLPRTQRRTTSGFELALSVLFTSGIQHYAEIPAGMAKVPDYVRDFLKTVPSVWDDTRFLSGYPGQYVVLARQAAGRWYVAGINAELNEKTVTLNLADLRMNKRGTGVLITDGGKGNLSFRRDDVELSSRKTLTVTLAPHGGFVLVFAP